MSVQRLFFVSFSSILKWVTDRTKNGRGGQSSSFSEAYPLLHRRPHCYHQRRRRRKRRKGQNMSWERWDGAASIEAGVGCALWLGPKPRFPKALSFPTHPNLNRAT